MASGPAERWTTSAGMYHPSFRLAPHVSNLPLNSARLHAFCGPGATREDGGGALTYIHTIQNMTAGKCMSFLSSLQSCEDKQGNLAYDEGMVSFSMF